jgi:pimeloyl-ACP methyl ester carboxylesterase
MKKITVNGIELAYARRGKGTPLALLHGFPLDHHLWDDVIPLLEDTFDLITPDLRGFGESTTLNTPHTMDDFASDIARLLDHLGIERTAIAGHSMGGYVALAFARLYPDRVSGLGLVSSQVLADTLERREGRYKSADEVAEKGTSGVLEAMTTKFTHDGMLQGFVCRMMERQQPAAYIGALKAMAERLDSTSLLLEIKYPVVVIHGDADALIPIDRAREVKTALPKAHFLELSNVGHMPMMEAVQETANALKSLA